MKYKIFFFALLVVPSILFARLYKVWSYQELYGKAELIVIAKPIQTKVTDEHIMLAHSDSIGVLTELAIKTVMKGNTNLSSVAVHHYQNGTNSIVLNGPGFVSFDLKGDYLLFLIKESEKQYIPVAGQTDSHLSIFKLNP
jgi:hypothetical protein